MFRYLLYTLPALFDIMCCDDRAVLQLDAARHPSLAPLTHHRSSSRPVTFPSAPPQV